MSETRKRITPQSLAAMRAVHARIAPFLPPEMAQAIWIARLSGHYDPAAGKAAVPALGLNPPGEQPSFPGNRMPGPLAAGGRFGARDFFGQATLPPNTMAARNPMPDMSGPLESPFVRAARASMAASSAQQRPAAQPIAPAPTAYAYDGRNNGGLFGGAVTPVKRDESIPGTYTKEHAPTNGKTPTFQWTKQPTAIPNGVITTVGMSVHLASDSGGQTKVTGNIASMEEKPGVPLSRGWIIFGIKIR